MLINVWKTHPEIKDINVIFVQCLVQFRYIEAQTNLS